MTSEDLIGIIGVGIILLAYFLQIVSVISAKSKLFLALNIIGSALACYASILINYWPFVILEGTWCIVSIFGLIKYFRKPTQGTSRDS